MQLLALRRTINDVVARGWSAKMVAKVVFIADLSLQEFYTSNVSQQKPSGISSLFVFSQLVKIKIN